MTHKERLSQAIYPITVERLNTIIDMVNSLTDQMETLLKQSGTINLTGDPEIPEPEVDQLLKSKIHEYVLEKVKSGEITFTKRSDCRGKEYWDAVDPPYVIYFSESTGLVYGKVELNYPLADEIMRIAKRKAAEKAAKDLREQQSAELHKVARRLGFSYP
jgi:hypothetical protein